MNKISGNQSNYQKGFSTHDSEGDNARVSKSNEQVTTK